MKGTSGGEMMSRTRSGAARLATGNDGFSLAHLDCSCRIQNLAENVANRRCLMAGR